MTRRFDAVELELLWRRLISLVDEAAAADVVPGTIAAAPRAVLRLAAGLRGPCA